jgi:transmembrane sensor
VNDSINDSAIWWHMALESEEADWDGFTRWLEADPRHRLAYDAIALTDDLVSRHRSTLAVAIAAEPPSRANRPDRRLAFGGLGAALALLLLLPTLTLLRPGEMPPQALHYASATGETRNLALADGTAVALASASRLDVADNGRDLRLAGAAAFDVPHRPGRNLVVHVGGLDIVDIGTRFEVSTAPGLVRVRVAEGRIAAHLPDGQHIDVVAGRLLLVDTARGTAQLAPSAAGDFAAWRRGRLVYDGAPLALVAADVSRHSGTEVRIDRGVASRRFSGILTIGNGSGLVHNLAQIMDLDVRPEGRAVRLVPRHAGDRSTRPAG